MKAGNLILNGDGAYYTYQGKGGKQGHRELPQPALNAIRASLGAFGKDLATMPPDESLWPSHSHQGKGITSGTSTATCKDTFDWLALHPPEYTSSVTRQLNYRRDAGETVEEVSRFLDHSSLAVTTVYLRRLKGEQDKSWAKVAEAIGV